MPYALANAALHRDRHSFADFDRAAELHMRMAFRQSDRFIQARGVDDRISANPDLRMRTDRFLRTDGRSTVDDFVTHLSEVCHPCLHHRLAIFGRLGRVATEIQIEKFFHRDLRSSPLGYHHRRADVCDGTAKSMWYCFRPR